MKTVTVRRNSGALIGLIFFVSSCSHHTDSLTSAQYSVVKDSVQRMVESIAADVSRQGPIAWNRWFENSPGFFMVSDGQMVFPDIDKATNFIKNVLVKNMPEIKLHWSNIRIDPVNAAFAGISAAYHEDITDPAGKTTPYDGYFTGIAHKTPEGWKIRNAHWSANTRNAK